VAVTALEPVAVGQEARAEVALVLVAVAVAVAVADFEADADAEAEALLLAEADAEAVAVAVADFEAEAEAVAEADASEPVTASSVQLLLAAESHEFCFASPLAWFRHLPLLALTRWYFSPTALNFHTCDAFPLSHACCCTALPLDADASFTPAHSPLLTAFTVNPAPEAASFHVRSAALEHAAPPNCTPLAALADGTSRHVPSAPFTSRYVPAPGPEAFAVISTPPAIAPPVNAVASPPIKTVRLRFVLLRRSSRRSALVPVPVLTW
jgi:PHD/YefM family antitoxin component YafN of YafNO toxin-antitoxin module